MVFSIDYVLSRYYHEHLGAEFVYYPAKAPKRLFITFAAVSPEGKSFNRIEQFWSPEECWTDTAYLFFRDRPAQEYRDVDGILQVIREYRQITGTELVATCGSSIGSYGALLVGLLLPATMVLLTAPRWPGDARPPHLDEAMQRCLVLPKCYIESRGLREDQIILKYVVDRYRELGGLCLFHSQPHSQVHMDIHLWSPDFTRFITNLLENWNAPSSVRGTIR